MSLVSAELYLETDRYVLQLAQTEAEVWAAQRLRFQVFNIELQEGLAESHALERDQDRFDAVCDHLLVTEKSSGEVVGTYRMQTGESAGRNLGYYSATEFDFTPFESARRDILELGRACIADGHRNQSVLGLLWKGIARYAKFHGARYLVGCSSITSQDAAGGLATYRQLAKRCEVAEPWRTLPLAGWRCGEVEGRPLKVPKLMAAYLALGARICGEPALDREFGTIVFLTWLDLESLPLRVLRKYLS
ncbi:MAG: GNAT family N-acetyltransferase [Synoicihabitans sp.]